MRKTMIDQETLAHLSAATTHGNELRLSSTLDRGVYARVKKIIEAAGGKWDRGAAAHIFPNGAAEAIDPILLTGEIIRPSDMGQFDSPESVVGDVITMAKIAPGMLVLEPSAGMGNLARPARNAGCDVRCVEIAENRAKLLTSEGFKTRCADFMSIDPDTITNRFDRVIMNPPFAKQADIDHVLHASEFLKPGGRLVAVMSAGVNFRQDRKASGFRMFLNSQPNGAMRFLPDGSFRMAGTNVKTVIVAFDKAA